MNTQTVWRVGAAFTMAFLLAGVALVSVKADSDAAPAYVQSGTAVGSADQIQVRDFNQVGAKRAVLQGWGFDRNTPNQTTDVRIVDNLGTVVDTFTTTNVRMDVQAVYPEAPAHNGFQWVIPSRYYDGGSYAFEVWVQLGNELNTFQLVDTIWMEPMDLGVVGAFDAVTEDATVAGWAIDLDGSYLAEQRLPVLIYIDGEFVTTLNTDWSRLDVAQAYGQYSIGPEHGFHEQIQIPERFRNNGWHVIEAFTVEVSESKLVQLPGVHWRYIDTDGHLSTSVDTGAGSQDVQNELDTIQF